MTKAFLEAFVITVRDQIIMKNTVEVKGVGVFKAEHMSQQQEKRADGTTVMMPPKDYMEFKADLED